MRTRDPTSSFLSPGIFHRYCRVVIFASCTLVHSCKLRGEATEDDASLVADVASSSLSRVIKVLMKTSMNIYPFARSQLHLAPIPSVVWRRSSPLRRNIKLTRLAKFYQHLIQRSDAARTLITTQRPDITKRVQQLSMNDVSCGCLNSCYVVPGTTLTVVLRTQLQSNCSLGL